MIVVFAGIVLSTVVLFGMLYGALNLVKKLR